MIILVWIFPAKYRREAGTVGAVTAQSEPDNTESVSVKCLQLFPLSHHFNDS